MTTNDIDAIRQRAERYSQTGIGSGKTIQAIDLANKDVPALLAKVDELTTERDAEHADAENLREALRDNDNCNDFLQRTVDGLRAELAAKDAVIEAAKTWRRAVAETGDYEISDSDVLIAAIDALPKSSEVAR